MYPRNGIVQEKGTELANQVPRIASPAGFEEELGNSGAARFSVQLRLYGGEIGFEPGLGTGFCDAHKYPCFNDLLRLNRGDEQPEKRMNSQGIDSVRFLCPIEGLSRSRDDAGRTA